MRCWRRVFCGFACGRIDGRRITYASGRRDVAITNIERRIAAASADHRQIGWLPLEVAGDTDAILAILIREIDSVIHQTPALANSRKT